MAPRQTRRHTTPIPMAVTSLGTITVSGASSAETGQQIALTAAIDQKTENAILTWEGIGFDLYGDTTGGLTGDQDHDETINLTFTAPGTYEVKAGYSDVGADNSPQYSENFTITITAPVVEPGPEDPEPESQGPVVYESASLQTLFTENYRPILVEPADDGISFDVKRSPGSENPTPNNGEMDWMLRWLSFHFTGQITDHRADGYFRLTLDSEKARVIPGGGATPSRVITA